ncbi:MAG: Mur ligase family protein [Candidatus Fimimonas sp.]
MLYALWCALALCGCSLECLRVLQSASYKPKRGYFKVLISWYFAILCVLQLFSWLWWAYFPNEVLLCCVYTLVALILRFLPRKSPLKFTKRICRIVTAQFLLLFAACIFGLHYWVVLLPFVSLLSFAICLPVDFSINRKYLRSAQRKLQTSGLEVIAITGSYGKTSLKSMLCAVLEGAISPKGSCNTPLGIAKFVNSTSLQEHKYLVLEFGARQRGDIAQLCKLFNPKYGVVTGVCEQHLSTFKTFQNVVATKRELVESLPSNGFCVLCDESVRSFVQVGNCAKIEKPQIEIDNLHVTPKGLQFTATYNGRFEVNLPLISPYSAQNFAICATVCNLLGQSFEKTLQNVGKIRQVPHRMEIIFNGKFFIIDDSYNASIRGVESCCDVLSRLEGQKVAISQGIVEGGKKQRELNKQCGKLLGKVCNVVIVLGKNAAELEKGAKSCSNCTVLHAKSLQSAVQLVQGYLSQNDFLLFQNDLPDVVNV